MKTWIAVAAVGGLLLATTAARAQNADPAPAATTAPPAAQPKDGDSLDGQPGPQVTAQPVQAAPIAQPPAPPQAPPKPPAASKEPVATGQWVYTSQYGWVWIPYGEQYTYEPGDSDTYPYQYVYRVDLGWDWLIAPWVWGWGPLPYFGYWGPWHFHWYHGPGVGMVPHGGHIGPAHPGGVRRGFSHPGGGFHGGGFHGGGGHHR
jgi:hypothetical protein